LRIGSRLWPFGVGVLHFGRDDGVDLTVDQPFLFEAAESLGEHLLGDAFELPPELRIAESAAASQIEDRQALPLATEDLQSVFKGTEKLVFSFPSVPFWYVSYFLVDS
jgi:hypothetical protein